MLDLHHTQPYKSNLSLSEIAGSYWAQQIPSLFSTYPLSSSSTSTAAPPNTSFYRDKTVKTTRNEVTVATVVDVMEVI